MKLFGWSIIRTKELEYYQYKAMRISQIYRWFSGWKDLDIIWSYILSNQPVDDIETIRKKYAEARGTGVYGEKRGVEGLSKE